MSASDTPLKYLNSSAEKSSANTTPVTYDEANSNPLSPDSGLTDEDSVEGKVISLASKAAKDAKLTAGWDSHTSDEEEFIPDKDTDDTKDDDEDSDAELQCVDHNRCIDKGHFLFDALAAQNVQHKGSKKEAKSALVGVICDHFQFI